MMKSIQLALPLLFALSATLFAQSSGATSATAAGATAPGAVTTSQAAPSQAKKRAARNASRAAAGANGSGVRPASGTGPGTDVPTEAVDMSATGGKSDEGSPIDINSSSLSIPGFKNALGVASGTVMHVRLKTAIDSAHAKNGDMVDGVLTAPLGTAAAGSPVKLTVVEAAPAGSVSSAGELSLQVMSVNGETVLSSVITAEGEAAKTSIADDVPARGTEASFTPDKPIDLPAS